MRVSAAKISTVFLQERFEVQNCTYAPNNFNHVNAGIILWGRARCYICPPGGGWAGGAGVEDGCAAGGASWRGAT